VGRLEKPEALEATDIFRLTASIHYVRPVSSSAWASSVVWARNYKTAIKEAGQAILAETLVPIGRKNIVTGRFEWSQRDELFSNNPSFEHRLEHFSGLRAYNIGAYTVGYTRDFHLFGNVQTGIGGNLTAYSVPSAIQPYYGAHPVGFNVFLRARLVKGD
jgi:hypothetical protein